MPDWMPHIFFPVSRWLHIVGATLLLGGTLFFEFVVPRAVEDMREEQKLAVYGRLRWVFRQVVLSSAFLLVASGTISLMRVWPGYQAVQPDPTGWVWGHVALSGVAILIALRVVVPGPVPNRPLWWMRLNTGLLLISILVAGGARYVRLMAQDEEIRKLRAQVRDMRVAPARPPVESHE